MDCTGIRSFRLRLTEHYDSLPVCRYLSCCRR
jgi:hypothetical protein